MKDDWNEIQIKALEDAAKTVDYELFINGLERAHLQVCVNVAIEKYGELLSLLELKDRLDNLTQYSGRGWGE